VSAGFENSSIENGCGVTAVPAAVELDRHLGRNPSRHHGCDVRLVLEEVGPRVRIELVIGGRAVRAEIDPEAAVVVD
jgi:hypothetical protein